MLVAPRGLLTPNAGDFNRHATAGVPDLFFLEIVLGALDECVANSYAICSIFVYYPVYASKRLWFDIAAFPFLLPKFQQDPAEPLSPSLTSSSLESPRFM